MADLRVVGEDDGTTPFTVPVTTFRAEFFGCTQASTGDKKLVILVDRLDRYKIDELADVGLTMEFTVARKPIPADNPDHPSHNSGRVRPQGKISSIPDSHADEPLETRPKNSSLRRGRRKSGEGVPHLRDARDPASFLPEVPPPGGD